MHCSRSPPVLSLQNPRVTTSHAPVACQRGVECFSSLETLESIVEVAKLLREGGACRQRIDDARRGRAGALSVSGPKTGPAPRLSSSGCTPKSSFTPRHAPRPLRGLPLCSSCSFERMISEKRSARPRWVSGVAASLPPRKSTSPCLNTKSSSAREPRGSGRSSGATMTSLTAATGFARIDTVFAAGLIIDG